MNDYEIIHLIQTENDGVAFNNLFNKYEGLICKYISLYNIPLSDKEDYLSEGRLVLSKAALSFDERYDKTFTRFFEMMLKQHFWKLIKKEPKYVLNEEIMSYINSDKHYLSQNTFYKTDSEDAIDELIKSLSEFENIIFEYYYVLEKSVTFISKKLKIDTRSVYNAIYRIKDKLRSIL